MYQVIHLIIQPEKVDLAVSTAKANGARTATLLKARGCGHGYREKILNVPIDAQMSFLFIIVESHLCDTILRALDRELNLREAGQGILFTAPLFSYQNKLTKS